VPEEVTEPVEAQAEDVVHIVALVAAPRSGNMKVWLPPVKSAEVIVAVKPFAVAVDCGLIAIESLPAVVEEKVAELVVVKVEEKTPEVWVKPVIFCKTPAPVNLETPDVDNEPSLETTKVSVPPTSSSKRLGVPAPV
jgi:hypothetical protein